MNLLTLVYFFQSISSCRDSFFSDNILWIKFSMLLLLVNIFRCLFGIDFRRDSLTSLLWYYTKYTNKACYCITRRKVVSWPSSLVFLVFFFCLNFYLSFFFSTPLLFIQIFSWSFCSYHHSKCVTLIHALLEAPPSICQDRLLPRFIEILIFELYIEYCSLSKLFLCNTWITLIEHVSVLVMMGVM